MRILDLDNCISDDGWRIPAIGQTPPWRIDSRNVLDQYHIYHSLALWDEMANEELVAEPWDEQIVILTARPVFQRSVTMEWLRRKDVPFAHLLMRNNNDLRSSLRVKREQVISLQNDYGLTLGSITAAYDDRPDIVAMYRDEFGFKAEVRAIHSIPYPASVP